jgi:thymidine kinase
MSKLYFHYSAMNAGKSIALLQVAHNYEEQGQKVLLFTSAKDNRYGVGKITSRLGPSREAATFNDEFDFEKELEGRVEGIKCILVDEAQFMTKAQVIQLHRIAQCWGIPVMTYGIRSDSKGNPFDGSGHLMTLAESVEELKTVCSCMRKATMNMRIDSQGNMVLGGEQVVIGGNDSYRAVCARCFYTTQNARRKQLDEQRLAA